MNKLEENLAKVKRNIIFKLKEFEDVFDFLEKDMVYFLSLTRQLLEMDKKEKGQRLYLQLWFFTNWCLHIELCYSKYGFLYEEPEREFIKSNDTRAKKELPLLDIEEKKRIYTHFVTMELLELSKLKKQFIEFFSEYKIFIKVFEDHKLWCEFRKKLLKILANKPYIIKEEKSLIHFLIIENNQKMAQANPGSHVGDLKIYFKDESVRHVSLVGSVN